MPAATLPASPVPKKKPRGPRVNLDWREDFCRSYQQQGGLYAAAEYAGVNSSTVYAEMERNPEFKRAAEEARQRFADSQEQQLATLGKNGNVVGPIVLLKKHRPAEYIERNLTVTANFTASLDAAAGQQLLTALLGQAGAHLQALKPAEPDQP